MKRIITLAAALLLMMPLSAQWMCQPTPNDTLRSTIDRQDGKNG